MPSPVHSVKEVPSTPEAAPRLLQAEDFVPLVGRRVRFVGTSFDLTLERVDRPRGPGPVGLPRAPFALLFTGVKSGVHLPEGLYRCDFGEDDVFDLHVAPIHTPSADRQDYEAAFN